MTAAHRPGGRLVAVGAVVVALIVAGALLTHLGGGAPTSEHRSPERRNVVGAAAPMRTPGPAAEQAGMPVGFTRRREGAVAAAVAYATASQRWLYFTDDEIKSAIAEIATPAAESRLTGDVVADVSRAREGLGASSGPVWWLVRPLATEVVHHDRDEARVSVWALTVLSAAGVAAPQAEWMTVTIDLAWVAGDWRVDAVRDIPGPTPMIGPGDRPWDAEAFNAALDGFARMDGEPVR